jgi:two-component sensor histidine kinase
LTRDIHHRTQNLFCVVQAIVARSFDGKRSVREAESAVLNRLSSLAQTHVMVLDKQWKGAELGDIVRAEMDPYADRVKVWGQSLMLNAKAAQHLGLALHELATNAAKYGALSNSTGWVHICWSVDDAAAARSLGFRWQEHGGPLVKPPGRRGFGCTVLERVMAECFDEQPHIEFAASGLVYELNLSLAAIPAGA